MVRVSMTRRLDTCTDRAAQFCESGKPLPVLGRSRFPSVISQQNGMQAMTHRGLLRDVG